jgi:hypothetical protein
VLGLVLAEVDYFLRDNRAAVRKLVAEIFDPATRYEHELLVPADIVRALELDASFGNLNLGLVDGTVAAVAERRGVYRVTTDRRTSPQSVSVLSQLRDLAIWRQGAFGASRQVETGAPEQCGVSGTRSLLIRDGPAGC